MGGTSRKGYSDLQETQVTHPADLVGQGGGWRRERQVFWSSSVQCPGPLRFPSGFPAPELLNLGVK